MRKALLAVVMVVISAQGWYTSMAQSNSQKVIAEFPGSTLKWIEAAEPEFHRRNLDLSNYIVAVVDYGDSVIVALSSPDQPAGARGSVGKYPGYEVEISKNGMKILRSNFVR
jgi:hypothetical protein